MPEAERAARALDNFTGIQLLLQNTMVLQNTPTPEAIDEVRKSFAANPPPPGSPAIIVLATDGMPDTCTVPNPATPTEQDAANLAAVVAAQKAHAAGIELFFLFVGDEQAGALPQRMANAGAGQDPVSGTAPFYVATDPVQLTAAFNANVDRARSCDLTLSGDVDLADAPNGIVEMDGEALTYSTDWTLDSDGHTIHLLGDACMKRKTATSATVDARFPCPM